MAVAYHGTVSWDCQVHTWTTSASDKACAEVANRARGAIKGTLSVHTISERVTSTVVVLTLIYILTNLSVGAGIFEAASCLVSSIISNGTLWTEKFTGIILTSYFWGAGGSQRTLKCNRKSPQVI
jgi:hypothetical protein